MHFLFAWRYFKAKKSTNAINVIAWISMLAILFGTAALILVLSVFNGLEGLVKSLYSSFYTDLKIVPAEGKLFSFDSAQLGILRQDPSIAHYSFLAEEKALVRNGDRQSVVQLMGVDSNYPAVAGVVDHMLKGEFYTGTEDAPSLVLGAGIEDALEVQSDRSLFPLTVYLPRRTAVAVADPMSAINADSINVSGSFVIQQEFDNTYALTNLAFMKRMLEMGPDQFSAIDIKLRAGVDADDAGEKLGKSLGPAFKVQTRFQQNEGLYSVMRTEKWLTYAILSLILLIAAFTMIAALTMLVLEKQKDIAILHALGGTRGFIQRIFLSEGMILAILGAGGGMLIALLLAWAQIQFHLIPLQGGSFLIDYYPVTLQLSDFLLVGLTVFVIAVLASWIPSRKASRQDFSLRAE